MNDKNYPLIEVIRLKKRRLDEAEKILREKKEILTKEEDKLKIYQKELNEAKIKFDTYLQKLREAMDKGEPSSKIDQHKLHLKDLKDLFLVCQKKVDNQKKVVKSAQEAVETARLEYQMREKELEKLTIHKAEWLQAMKLEQARAEELKMDEISTSAHARKKKE